MRNRTGKAPEYFADGRKVDRGCARGWNGGSWHLLRVLERTTLPDKFLRFPLSARQIITSQPELSSWLGWIHRVDCIDRCVARPTDAALKCCARSRSHRPIGCTTGADRANKAPVGPCGRRRGLLVQLPYISIICHTAHCEYLVPRRRRSGSLDADRTILGPAGGLLPVDPASRVLPLLGFEGGC